VRRVAARWRALFQRRSAEQELDEELAFHVERETEKYRRSGYSPEEARRLALAAFGGVVQAKEAHRDVRGLPWLEQLLADVRYAWRGLARSRALTIAAVLTLSLGTGATTVVVSAVRTLFFQSTAITEPERVFTVWQGWPGGFMPGTQMGQPVYSYEHVLAFRDGTRDVFEDLAGYSYEPVSLRSGESARTLSALLVSGSFFRTLGLRPALGRFITAEQDRPGGAVPEVVIGYDLWQREFGGDSAVLGRTLYADSRLLTVIGVAPRRFTGVMLGLAGDVFIPTAVYREPPPGAPTPRHERGPASRSW